MPCKNTFFCSTKPCRFQCINFPFIHAVFSRQHQSADSFTQVQRFRFETLTETVIAASEKLAYSPEHFGAHFALHLARDKRESTVSNVIKRFREWVGCACWLPNWLRWLLGSVLRGPDNFEVERKYSLRGNEREDLRNRLLVMGFQHAGEAYEHDRFMPTVVDGDMFRIREETIDSVTKNYLTLKTWVEVDGERERSEKEEEISELVKESFIDLGTRLNPRPLLQFNKHRSFYTRIGRDKRKVTVALDLTEGLGEFDGPYMEIEILVTRREHVASARQMISQLVHEILGEARDPVEMSYLTMLKRSAAAQNS